MLIFFHYGIKVENDAKLQNDACVLFIFFDNGTKHLL
jgi:spore coat polysaccharide biosynthesis predicted glycosyltransferase SpsG